MKYAGERLPAERLVTVAERDGARLRPAQQLLKPRDILKTQFQGFRALVGVAQDRLALHPIVLLLEIKEPAQTGGAWASSGAHRRSSSLTTASRTRGSPSPA